MEAILFEPRRAANGLRGEGASWQLSRRQLARRWQWRHSENFSADSCH